MMQATFLKAKSLNAQNSALREELEQLEPEPLALRCRRNGLSREGGRETQIQRLLNLQAYLSGDTEAEPAPKKAPPEALPQVSLYEASRFRCLSLLQSMFLIFCNETIQRVWLSDLIARCPILT